MFGIDKDVLVDEVFHRNLIIFGKIIVDTAAFRDYRSGISKSNKNMDRCSREYDRS